MKGLLFAALAVAAGLASAAPKATVTGVTVDARTQRVTVSYTLDAPAVVTADLRVNGTDVALNASVPMSGDVNRRVDKVGTACTFGWTPSGPMKVFAQGDDVKVAVKAWATNAPPDWLVIDLTEPFEARYYTSAAAIPGGIGGAVNKTAKMVMRKIPAKGVVWKMGSVGETTMDSWKIREAQHDVTLTDDYYIGVYQVTLGQYKSVFKSYPSNSNFTTLEDHDFIPVNGLSYNVLRGKVSDGIDWPNNTDDMHKVLSTSTLQGFRDKMTFKVDLPTDAQWEFACRAGKGTWYNDGATSSANLTNIAWYSANSYPEGFPNGRAFPVGLKPANAFGLCDMHGNVMEWCLDWLKEGLDLGTLPTENPVGAPSSSDNTRVMRGGSYNYSDTRTRCAFREAIAPDSGWANLGFRLACPAEAVK